MKKLIKMPSIEQFRNVVKNIQHMSTFVGLDSNGDPIYNKLLKAPILKAIGTVKLHGTNAAVCYNDVDGMWFQSKENIITPQVDNAGFAFFGTEYTLHFLNIINGLNVDTKENTVTVYGEWAGKGIQKGIGIGDIQKSFFIFGIKITPFDEEKPAFWLENYELNITSDRIFDIRNFKTFEIDIDFNNALFSQNKMVDWVIEVENECPVAKTFGISGIGEGIVFTVKYNDSILRWKMKGEKHAGKSKVKSAKKVDDVRLQLIIDIVNQVTPEWRLEQMYQETFDTLNGGVGDIKGTGDFIRKVINDIIKEDSDIINDAGLIPKDINSNVSKVAREWLVNKLNKESGLV
jgi:hypothetical protein